MTLNRRTWLLQGSTAAIGAALGAGLATKPLVAASASVQSPGRWSQAPAMPLAVQELYPAVFQQRLYVAGGIAARLGVPYFTSRCVSFSAKEQSWREESELPEALHHAALAATDKTLTLAGGFNGGYTHIWRMRKSVYTLGEDGWKPAIDLPRPQAEGVFTSATDGALHLVTGQSPKGQANGERSDHTEVNDHRVLAPGTNAWESLAPIPTPRNSATGGWLDANHLLVVGGRTAAGNLAVAELYDRAEDRWRTVAPMPLPQAGTASVVVGSNLLVFGGEIFVPEAGVFAQCWRYRRDEDRWEALPDLPTPRHGLGAGVLGDNVFVVGGATRPSGRGTSDCNESLSLEGLLPGA